MFLIAAPVALAGTVNYTIAESPAYAIQDNGNGIVKVTYNGCVTAGERQNLAFNMVTNVSGDANATFNILREEGVAPVATFNPASVFLTKGQSQTFDVVLSFTIDDVNDGRTTFRIKLDPESGEGLGQGAGVMVTIPCVLAPPPPTPTAPVTAPAAGYFPPVQDRRAASPSRCIATPSRMRLRAGQTTLVRVTVTVNDHRIQGARIRATYPGATQVRRTGENGVVTIRVRPRRAGTLVLQSEVCFGADRLSVLGARAVAGRGDGRFTG